MFTGLKDMKSIHLHKLTHHGTAEPHSEPTLRIGFLLMHGFNLVPVAALIDALRTSSGQRSRTQLPICQWEWMTLNDLPVVTNCGMKVSPTQPLSSVKEYDYVILAGGTAPLRRASPDWLLRLLRELRAKRTTLVALCGASLVLGHAGLLDGRRCAAHASLHASLALHFPAAVLITNQELVEDDGIITCPGGSCGKLAARLITHLPFAQRGRAMESNPARLRSTAPSSISKGDDEQARTSTTKGWIQEVTEYMRTHLDQPVSSRRLAAIFQINKRELNQAFTSAFSSSPAQYWRQLRLDHGRDLLITTSLPVANIAHVSGFSNSSHFTLWFRKRFGETPLACRHKHQFLQEKGLDVNTSSSIRNSKPDEGMGMLS